MKSLRPLFALAMVSAALSLCASAQQFRVSAPAIQFISAMGAKCLDVEGGNFQPGTRIILYDCSANKPNQMFSFLSDGQIRAGNTGLCVDDRGGMYRSMDQIVLWPCNQSSSRWRFIRGQLLSPNNMCIDLRGGTQRWYLGNQDAILYQCNGQTNQHFVAGIALRPGQGTSGYNPGQQGSIYPKTASSIMTISGNSVIAAGGGNVIAAGGGNVIGAGAGNVIAAGGGNVIAAGGGNVIAAGGGNVIVPIGDTVQ